MARSVSNPNEQAATVRNLKVLVVLLVVSNILVGVLGVYLLRTMDRRYSELVNRTVPVLNDLQTLIAQTVAAMRSTNPSFFEAPVNALQPALQRGRIALELNRTLQGKLLNAEWLPETSARRVEFKEAGEAFNQRAGETLDLFAAGQPAEANRHREGSGRKAFERYQKATTTIADYLLTESKVVNDGFTAKTSRWSAIVMGVASWPVIALVGLLLVTAAFVIAMMIAFRGKDLADTP